MEIEPPTGNDQPTATPNSDPPSCLIQPMNESNLDLKLRLTDAKSNDKEATLQPTFDKNSKNEILNTEIESTEAREHKTDATLQPTYDKNSKNEILNTEIGST